MVQDSDKQFIYSDDLLRKIFDEVDFLVGASADQRSCLAVLHYRDDCITPHLYVLVDGVRVQRFVAR